MSSRTDGILARIVERTLADVQQRRSQAPVRDLEERGRSRAGRRVDFEGAVRRGTPADPPRFICEIKKASPSKGMMNEALDPSRQAELYREHGAAAVSVVTEPHFFLGEDAFLGRARRGAGSLPLLRKDFHVHELQVLETAAGEADALLFIVSVLAPTQLRDYLDMAREFGLGHLVEVMDTREAEVALKAGATVVGVNNRDLTTFVVDVGRTERVLPALAGTGAVAVAESGIHDREVVVRLGDAGVHAFLVGEALVTAEDPGSRLRELRGADPE